MRASQHLSVQQILKFEVVEVLSGPCNDIRSIRPRYWFPDVSVIMTHAYFLSTAAITALITW